MGFATQRRVLYLLATTALIGGGAAIYWATAKLPGYQPITRHIESADPISGDQNTTENVSNGAVKRKLRGPLYDPPPKPPTPVVQKQEPKPPPKPKLNWTLVGTLIESGESVAIVADATGEFDVKGEGDSLELEPNGVQIKSIMAEQITVDFQGTETTIALDRKLRKGGNPKRNKNRGRP